MPNDNKQAASALTGGARAPLSGPAISSNASKDPRFFNATAYRIFKLLEWLVETPLTSKDINCRFLKDSLIGEVLSADSIGLYISTLRLVGCRIKRPTSKNMFHYELLTHPFGFTCDSETMDMLRTALLNAQSNLNYREMQLLESAFSKILHNNGEIVNYDQDMNHERTVKSEKEKWIKLLERGIEQDNLLFTRYLNHSKKEIEFYFLPELIYYEDGAIYVHGQSLNKLNSESYRLDSILLLRAENDSILLEELRQRRDCQERVLLRIYLPDPDSWNGLSLDIRHGVYAENVLARSNSDRPYVDVKYKVRKFEFLTQKLLGGYQFNILEPKQYRQDLQRSLQKMVALYNSL